MSLVASVRPTSPSKTKRKRLLATTSFLFHTDLLGVFQVRTWGILWRPCEVSHDRFTHVMNSVVRLHNFCRRRRVRVPARNVGDVGEPPVRFSRNNTMIGNYYDTVRNDRVWRPASNQAGLPQTREAIRTRLEIEGIMRPRVDIDRNARGGGGPFPGAEEGGGYCA